MSQATSILPQAIACYFTSTSTSGDAAAPPDPAAFDPADVARVQRHLEVAARRAPDTPVVAVSQSDTGGVEIVVVNDDRSLLVEAILATVEEYGLIVGRLDHPIVPVARTSDGEMVAIGTEDPAARPESWIWVTAQSQRSDIDLDALRADVSDVISRVNDVGRDATAMRERLRELARTWTVGSDPARDEYGQLIKWFDGNHFLPLGYVHATAEGDAKSAEVLGVWRTEEVSAECTPLADGDEHPRVCRVFRHTGILRSDYPVLLQIPALSEHGEKIGEHRFLGTFTSSGLHHTVMEIPVLRDKARAILDRAGMDEGSYAGQSILELLQNYPLVEMFEVSTDELGRQIDEMLDAVATRSLRLFVRANPDGQVASALVYLPRDRYTTVARLALQDKLIDELGGADLEYTARVSETPLALLSVLIRVERDAARALGSLATGGERHAHIQAELAEIIRTWDERVRELAGPTVTPLLTMLPSLPADYKDQRSPRDAVGDLRIVAGLAPGDITVTLGDPPADAPGDGPKRWVFTVYLCDATATLTDVLPVLHSLGVDVLDEHPYTLVRADGIRCGVYEFGVTLAPGMTVDTDAEADLAERFTEAFEQMWRQNAEVDAVNELIFRCGLDWRSAAMLRAYGRYLKQCGFSYSTSHVADVLGDHPAVTRALVELFAASFDPDRANEERRERVLAELRRAVGEVISLDADRILSAFVSVLTATSRTNFYVAAVDAERRPVVSFKLRTREIPQAPQPQPLHEIFVYSPRVEGVHLRFGTVARGGLRWSDRRDDFRTEILGLVKAQAVKNAVIVPLGAKGGFIVKRPPSATGDATADREAQRAEGIACYRDFIAGLLDVTDNIDHQSGSVVPAPGVVRRDGDDPYLVVAADKGTASFSDIANGVAAQYGFWLGDAFASGGSAGYDHKEMGITARGAWESVKRHFREMGIDTQAEDFTVVGIGDMSGDVFGNGMLLSEHIRLVAAFDHRHVFIDPNPDAAPSFAERARLFALPRSSWADYDTALISEGGGVWPRDQKSIPVSAQMRTALGLDDDITELSPPELIRAILIAPVDLLWNGGIGTYIKAATESDGQVGDKANDAIRVNGEELRAKVVGEGGNLGATERGRIEFDLAGGRINTDAMDNSAGVDCSDHEVNIKILLASAISSGTLADGERNPLLESMTDEVARLVLDDNISQNAELGFSRAMSQSRVDVHTRQLADLARNHGVDLALEALPTPAELRKRFAGELHRGLTSPELATLMAHVKLAAKDDLLATDLPDNEVFETRLTDYFPEPLHQPYAAQIASHRLRREIVTTSLVNDVVDKAGGTHLFRLSEGSGASTDEGVRSYVATTTIFGMDDLFDRIRSSGASIPAIDEMTLYARRLVFRSSRWMLGIRPQPLAIGAEVTRYSSRVTDLTTGLADWLGESSRVDVDARAERFRAGGVDDALAQEVALSLHRFCLLDIIDVAEITEREPVEAAELYFVVMEHFGMEKLLSAVSDLDYGDRWHALARLALRDDLHGALRSLTSRILEVGEPDETAAEKIAEWESSQAARLARVRAMLADIAESGTLDLATLSVAARQLRSVIR